MDYIPASICTVPDGAAFLALEPRSDEPPRLLCYHLASFGSEAAVPVELPELRLSANMVVSCMGQTENLYAIFLDRSTPVCSSISLHITSKTSEYDFRGGGSRSKSVGKDTVHNSLIDCHSEVWTRYPVQAAIRRETALGTKHCPRSITFISSISSDSFSKYLTVLIHDFKRKTRKPALQLATISVAALPSFDPVSPDFPISQFKSGDWLVGLFCLIPIHIAVTGQNRFIPLCDGVISQEFEQSLLGADVARIAEAYVLWFEFVCASSYLRIRLSLGWYESIFASYLARKVSVTWWLHSRSNDILARQSGYLNGSVDLLRLLDHSHIIFRGTICWKKLYAEPFCGYLFRRVSDEMYRRCMALRDSYSRRASSLDGF